MDAPALTPELALAYLAELSTDIRGAVVLDGDGRTLAGDDALASSVRALVAGAGGDLAETASPAGTLVAGRGGGHILALEVGPHALLPLVRHDIRRVLGDLMARGGEAERT